MTLTAGESKEHKLRRRATYASVSVATVLIICKLLAYFYTDSVAVLSSLLDSTIDLLASAVTVFGVASALRPPDHDHRYGHGKAEPLAALAQSAFIAGSSVLLIYEAMSRFYHPHPLVNERIGYAVMAFAIVLSLVLIWYQQHVIKLTESTAIHADRTHYVGDIAVNGAVIVSFLIQTWTGHTWIDPVFAILIGVGLCVSAYKISIKALNLLMDKELPDSDREKIKTIVVAQPMVRGMHDLRTRSDGERTFIEFHLELDENMTLKVAHRVDEHILNALREAYPNADINIHQDPAGIEESRLDEQIEIRTTRK